MNTAGKILSVGAAVCISLMLSGLIASNAAERENTQRGKSLYENHCTECHTSVVHVRQDHKAKSIKEIEQFIIRWVNYKKIPWTMEEVQDVRAYINGEYYHYEGQSQ